MVLFRVTKLTIGILDIVVLRVICTTKLGKLKKKLWNPINYLYMAVLSEYVMIMLSIKY